MSTGYVRETVDVDAPPEQVWHCVADWPRQSEWIPATRVWSVDEAAGVGARIEAWTGIGRFGYLDTMTITAWDPPRRCEVLHTGRLLRGEGGFVVAPRGPHGTRLEWWERFRLPAGPVGAVLWPAARPLVSVAVRQALQQLKRVAESGPSVR